MKLLPKNSRLHAFLYRYLIPYGGFLFIRIISSTYRFRFLGLENERAALSRCGAVIYGGWHQRLFAGMTPFARRKPIAITISESRDGEFIAKIARLMGWRTVRGSSSRGGSRAFRELKSLAQNRYRIAHIVDGPLGPPQVIKPGFLRIARATGLPVVPACVSPEKPWVFNSWDRFMIPKPFSRILVRFGEPVFILKNMSKIELETERRKIEKGLKTIHHETDRIWDDSKQTRRLFG